MANLCDNFIREIIQSAGIAGPVLCVNQLPGGNNRVLKIDTSSGTYVFKQYYHQDTDLRDRYRTEKQFYVFLEKAGIRNVPGLIFSDEEHRILLLEYIDGQKASRLPTELVSVQALLDFILELNKPENLPEASSLPLASEACFSINGHRLLLKKRLAQLKTVRDDDEINSQAGCFIKQVLLPYWRELETTIQQGLKNDSDENWEGQRIISPSDAGFHNMKILDNKVYFFDFEYSGWDTPSKLVCDLFCHPDNPVPAKYLDLFLQKLSSTLDGCRDLKDSVQLLMPVIKVKWCCIMLNMFVPKLAGRKRFAFEGVDKREEQLAKLQEYARVNF